MGGGGLKGLAHLGILQVWEENHIPVNFLSGTSAGSLIAALYAAGMKLYQIEKMALGLNPGHYLDYNVAGLMKYLLGCYYPPLRSALEGIVKGDKIEKLVYELTQGKSLLDCRLPIAIVACDIDSGRQVVFTNRLVKVKDKNTIIITRALLSEAVRASLSIPGTFVPYYFKGCQLVDGGVKNMVPVDILKIMGAQYIVGINLGREIYQEKVQGILPIVSRSIDILAYETSKDEEQLYADLVVYPGVDSVDLGDIHRAPEIIRAGRRAMRSQVEEIKRGLAGEE